VSTSNRAPDKLYEGGLQRALFLPFIALLKERCEVHDIQGSQDYRRLARKLSQSLFFTGPDAFAELQCCMALFAPGLTPAPAEVEVMMGRTLRVPRAAGRVAYFTFAELCEQPVAAADFIALCTKYHSLKMPTS
jgi:predicted ATPase